MDAVHIIRIWTLQVGVSTLDFCFPREQFCEPIFGMILILAHNLVLSLFFRSSQIWNDSVAWSGTNYSSFMYELSFQP
jgi:hypothetical protein